VIEIKNLTMRYKNGKGVGDINISVDNGEVKGLLGPNGAGKSTTMRSLMGFLMPSEVHFQLRELIQLKTLLRQRK